MFAVAVETLVIGVYVGSGAAARAGAGLVAAAALTVAATAAAVWRRRHRSSRAGVIVGAGDATAGS